MYKIKEPDLQFYNKMQNHEKWLILKRYKLKNKNIPNLNITKSGNDIKERGKASPKLLSYFIH